VAPLDITSQRAGDILVVRARGELDLDTSREFRLRVDADLDRFGSRDLVLDLAGVTFLDSSGLGAILGRYKKVAENGGRLALAGFAPHVGRLLELSGIMRIVGSYPTVEDALRDLGGTLPAAGGGRP